MITDSSHRSADPLETRSLREQVYEYLRAEMHKGRILPGDFIRLNAISRQLGISKTPLRDAVIQLECEGFVTILPRRGVMMNRLDLDDVRDAYQIVGALEAAVVAEVAHRFNSDCRQTMQAINDHMKTLLERSDFDDHYADFFACNVAFHNGFLDLSANHRIKSIVIPLKQRLYDFPRRRYIREWERRNCEEHDFIVQYLSDHDATAAADLLQHRHWSFSYYEDHIKTFYDS